MTLNCIRKRWELMLPIISSVDKRCQAAHTLRKGRIHEWQEMEIRSVVAPNGICTAAFILQLANTCCCQTCFWLLDYVHSCPARADWTTGRSERQKVKWYWQSLFYRGSNATSVGVSGFSILPQYSRNSCRSLLLQLKLSALFLLFMNSSRRCRTLKCWIYT